MVFYFSAISKFWTKVWIIFFKEEKIALEIFWMIFLKLLISHFALNTLFNYLPLFSKLALIITPFLSLFDWVRKAINIKTISEMNFKDTVVKIFDMMILFKFLTWIKNATIPCCTTRPLSSSKFCKTSACIWTICWSNGCIRSSCHSCFVALFAGLLS